MKRTEDTSPTIVLEDVQPVVAILKQNLAKWFTAKQIWQEHPSNLTSLDDVFVILHVLHYAGIIRRVKSGPNTGGDNQYQWIIT